MWSDFKSVWTKQWTKLWGWLKVTAGSIALGLHYVGAAVNDAGIKAEIDKLSPPVWASLGLAILGFVTIASMAHKDEDA